MKLALLKRNWVASQAKALGLEQKATRAREAAENASTALRRVKVRLKQAKREAKQAKQFAKKLLKAQAQAQSVYEEAASDAALVEKKLRNALQKTSKSEAKPEKARTPKARAAKPKLKQSARGRKARKPLVSATTAKQDRASEPATEAVFSRAPVGQRRKTVFTSAANKTEKAARAQKTGAPQPDSAPIVLIASVDADGPLPTSSTSASTPSRGSSPA